MSDKNCACCEEEKPIGLYVSGVDSSYNRSEEMRLKGQPFPNVGEEEDWIQVASSVLDGGVVPSLGRHYLAIKSDGTLWAYGDGSSGQLGDGSCEDKWDKPIQIGTGRWKSVACGNGYSLAVSQGGELYSWGCNDSGQLGNGSICENNTPQFEASWAQTRISSSVDGIAQPRWWGTGYNTAAPKSVAPQVQIRAMRDGLGGGASAVVTQMNLQIQKVSVTSGGSGYTSPPTVSFEGGGGLNSGAVAIVRGGSVVAVVPTINSFGFRDNLFGSRLYNSAPTVVFSGGGGSGAAATATMAGLPETIELQSAGSGYAYPPHVDWTVDGASVFSGTFPNNVWNLLAVPTRLSPAPLSTAFLSSSVQAPKFRATPLGKVLNTAYGRTGGSNAFRRTDYAATTFGGFLSMNEIAECSSVRLSQSNVGGDSAFDFTAFDTNRSFRFAYRHARGDVPIRNSSIKPTATVSVIGGGGTGTSFSVSDAQSTAGWTSAGDGYGFTVTMDSAGSGHVTDPLLVIQLTGVYGARTVDFASIKPILEENGSYEWKYEGMNVSGLTSGSQPSGYQARYGPVEWSGYFGSSNTPYGGYVRQEGLAPVEGGGGSGAVVIFRETWDTNQGGYVWVALGMDKQGSGYNEAPTFPEGATLSGYYYVSDGKDVVYIPLVIDGPATSTDELSRPALIAKPLAINYGDTLGGYQSTRLSEGTGGECRILLDNARDSSQLSSVSGVAVSQYGSGYRASPTLHLANPVRTPRLVSGGWQSVSACNRTSMGIKSDGNSYWWGYGTGFASPRLQGKSVRVFADLLPDDNVVGILFSSPDGIGIPAVAAITDRVPRFTTWPWSYGTVSGQPFTPAFFGNQIVNLPSGVFSIEIKAPERLAQSVDCFKIINFSGGYTEEPSVTVIRNSTIAKLANAQIPLTWTTPESYLYAGRKVSVTFSGADAYNSYPAADCVPVATAASPLSKAVLGEGTSLLGFGSRCRGLSIGGGKLFACGRYYRDSSNDILQCYSAAFYQIGSGYIDCLGIYAVSSSGSLLKFGATYDSSRGSTICVGDKFGNKLDSITFASCWVATDGSLWRYDARQVGVVEAVVSSPGSGYESFPDISGDTSVTPIVPSTGAVMAIGVYEGGSGYESPPSVTISGGGGSGASAVAKMRGQVTSLSLDSEGDGYSTVPKIEFSKPGIPAEAVAEASGYVSSISLAYSGVGYSSRPTVTISGGGGSGATAEAVFSGGVTSVAVIQSGEGYTSAPTVSFSGGGGSGAEATAVLEGGSVAYIRVTSSGSGYTQPPMVSLSGGDGSGATASSGILGTVTAINILSSGSGYTSAPFVSIAGDSKANAIGVAVLSMMLTKASLTSTGKFSALFGQYAPIVSRATTNYTRFKYALSDIGGSYRQRPTASVVASGQVSSVSVSSGGSGFAEPPEVRIHGGGGSGATAVAYLSGSVQSIEISRSIAGLRSPPVVWVSGGGGSGATAEAVFFGVVSQVSLQSGGSYSSEPTVSFSDGNATISCTSQMLADGTFEISSITLDYRGDSYTSPPTVVVSGGTEELAATFSVVMNYTVNGINLLNGGSGYGMAPSVVVNGQSGLAIAKFSGAVAGVAVTNEGSGYITAPDVFIIGGEADATATASLSFRGSGAAIGVSFSGKVIAVEVTSRGSGFTSEPTVSFSAPTLPDGVNARGRARLFYTTNASTNGDQKRVVGYDTQGRFAATYAATFTAPMSTNKWISPPMLATENQSRVFIPEMIYDVACVGVDNIAMAASIASAKAANAQIFVNDRYRYANQEFYTPPRSGRNQINAVSALSFTDEEGVIRSGADSRVPLVFGNDDSFSSGAAVVFVAGKPIISPQLSFLTEWASSGRTTSAKVVVHDEVGTGCEIVAAYSTSPYVRIANRGSNYTAQMVMESLDSYAPQPRTASASCAIISGGISSVTVSDGGSGYAAPPAVLAFGGGGTGASFSATIGYSIESVSFRWFPDNATDTELQGANVVISDQFEISPASLSFVKDGNFWKVNVISGGVYSQKPDISFSVGTIRIIQPSEIVMSKGFVNEVKVASSGSGYTSSPRLVFDAGLPNVIKGTVHTQQSGTQFGDFQIEVDSISHFEFPRNAVRTFLLDKLPTFSSEYYFPYFNAPSQWSSTIRDAVLLFIKNGSVFDVYQGRYTQRDSPGTIASMTASSPSGPGGQTALISISRPTWTQPASSADIAIRTDA